MFVKLMKIKTYFQFGSPKIFTGDLLNILNDHPTCLLIDAHDEHSTAIRQHLTDMHAEVIDHRKWGAPWPIIEIVKSGLNKAVGLQKFLVITTFHKSELSLSVMKIMILK